MAAQEQARHGEGTERPSIQFSPYAMKKTGFIQALSSLKVDVYSLICVPYSLSDQGCSLLVALSKDEIVFFQRFKGGLGGLTMAFQTPYSVEPLKLFARCSITAVSPIRGRDGVALIQTEFKPCPQDLVAIIKDYADSMASARSAYESGESPLVHIDPASAKLMGFNNYATLNVAGRDLKMALFAISTHEAQVLIPLGGPDLIVGSAASLKLYFKKYQFTVEGKVLSASRQPSGIQKASLSLSFSPELVELLDDYDLLARTAAKRAEQSAGA